MAVMGFRDFECTVCQRHFDMLSGDLMVPGPSICDECLKVLWELEGDGLTKYVSACLKENASRLGEVPESHVVDPALVNGAVQLIQWHKEKWGQCRGSDPEQRVAAQGYGVALIETVRLSASFYILTRVSRPDVRVAQ